LVALTRRSTSQPSYQLPLQLAQLVRQAQLPELQVALAPQLLPQVPQLVALVRRSTSQPSAHLPLQLP
jgi:hypothetical protein